MPMLNRRRFLSISALACALPAAVRADAPPLTRWRGIALGASASIAIRHPDAERLVAAARAEIVRLEGVFSLYRADSALSRLNAAGRLDAPPFEMLELLGLCGVANAATGGLFDPTVQPLWAAYADSYTSGQAPDEAVLASALWRVGWKGVRIATDSVSFDRPGMAMTLNGIAQGYIADRVAALLERQGLTDVLVDTGEIRALGGHPDGGAWRVELDLPAGAPKTEIALRSRAMASSSPRGTVLDPDGRIGHILHPVTGRPAETQWHLVSVTSPSAALADALSTAFCLMSRAEIERALGGLRDATLVYAG